MKELELKYGCNPNQKPHKNIVVVFGNVKNGVKSLDQRHHSRGSGPNAGDSRHGNERLRRVHLLK